MRSTIFRTGVALALLWALSAVGRDAAGQAPPAAPSPSTDLNPELLKKAATTRAVAQRSLATLTDVVTFYYRGVPASAPAGQKLDIEPLLGQSFTEIEDLVAFLKALSGEVPKVEPRELP